MAYTSAKSEEGLENATPFHQFRTKELAEQERVERELAVFQREQKDVAASAREEEERGEHAARDEAREALKNFKTSDMASLLQAAERDADAARSAVAAQARAQKDAAVDRLMEQITDPAFFHTTAA